jgi:beta-galactosidase
MEQSARLMAAITAKSSTMETLSVMECSSQTVHQSLKSIAAPVLITAKSVKTGKFEIFNKNFFVDLRDVKLRYEITVNGKVTSSGDVKLPTVKPRKKALFSLPTSALKADSSAGERFVNFSLSLASSTAWAHLGHEVAWQQIALVSKPLPKAKPAKKPQEYVNAEGAIVMPFAELAPQLTLWRAPTDNDRIGHISEKWESWGLRNVHRASSTVVRRGGTTKITHAWKTGNGISIKHIQTVESVESGLRVTDEVTLPKQLDDVARVGINFELNGGLDQLTYFGTGPSETAPDRSIGKVHRWNSTVSEQYVPYIKPQENGGHVGVRWFTLTNNTNRGLYFQLDKPRMVTVTPMRSTDLADATHDVFVKQSGNTVVTIDAIQRGVGTASCGPDTLAKYRIKPGTYKWSWTVLTF